MKYFLIIYAIIYYIVFMISLYKLFTKTNTNKNFAFIPIYNLYKYLKLANYKFWPFFIPVLNIIFLFGANYGVAKIFGQKRLICFLTMMFPIIFIPYLAFKKDVKYINLKRSDIFIRNGEDIDKLEKKLLNDKEKDDEFYEYKDNKITNEFISNTDKIISEIENFKNDDEYVEDEVFENKVEAKELIKNEDIDILETNKEEKENISVNDINELEQDIISENKIEKNIETNYQEHIEELDNDVVAFGGINKDENINSKNNSLTCPKCGSSLVGANGFCPGCGLKL